MGMPVSAAVAMLHNAEDKEQEWKRSVDDARQRYESNIIAHVRAQDAVSFARGEVWNAVQESLGATATPEDVQVAFNELMK